MERILIVLDTNKPNRRQIEFGCYLARLTKSKITGAFFSTPVPETVAVTGPPPSQSTADQQTRWFSEHCIKDETRFTIEHSDAAPLKEILAGSRYADLVVLDAETSFTSHYDGSPSNFVREVLQNSECPVVISPETFETIDEIVVACDGSRSSVFAIKQFTYLFPELRNRKITLVQASPDGKWAEEEKEKFNRWLSGHYPDIHFDGLPGDPESALFSFLLHRKNVFLVMGAFGRSSLSQFFRHSRAELIIRTITHPIFIAHH